MTFQSALYIGSVIHRRMRPRAHHLRYRVFWTLLDLDELPAIDRKLWFFSHNRGNLASFRDRDHGDGSSTPLRRQIAGRLAAAGIDADGPVRLLCMPRILGYGFNPLSVYFCHRKDGGLAAVLYEVHNTFRERHTYLIPVAAGVGEVVAQECAKTFYVSPFLDMDMAYAFRVLPPGEQVRVAISGRDGQGPLIFAALAGNRAILGDVMLLRVLATFPLLTLKVMVAIHWHALRMWLKGYRLRTRPRPPEQPVTVVPLKG